MGFNFMSVFVLLSNRHIHYSGRNVSIRELRFEWERIVLVDFERMLISVTCGCLVTRKYEVFPQQVDFFTTYIAC